MADFRQMGGIPEGYDQLLNSARQQLVRLPDGTLTMAPQFGQATSLEEIYGGILPPPMPSTPLASRSVSTVPVDMNGNPIITSSTGPGFSAPTAGATMAEQRSGSRPAITVGSQPAGTVQMPPGARPSNIPPMNLPPMGPPAVQTATAPIPRPRPLGAPVWDPFGTNVAKDESRLPTNDGGEAGFMAAFYPDATNPAVDAAGQMAGGIPMPRARPIPPASIPLTSLTGAPPTVPMPRNRPAPPTPAGTLGPITFKRGDTVSQLARDRGMTVKSFADLFGIKDPNKIRAGDTVMPSVPQPRMRPPSLGGGSTTPRNSGRWAGVLDEFGMII